MTETTKKEEAAESTDSSLDPRLVEALNTKGFALFLAKYPDSDVSAAGNPEATIEHFEVFKAVSTVSEGLKKLYMKDLKAAGFSLEGLKLDSVDGKLEDDAVADPERILDLNRKLKDFSGLPVQIKELEAKLAQSGDIGASAAELENLKALREHVTIAQKNMTISGVLEMMGDVTRAKETFESGKALRKAGINILHRGDVNTSGIELDKKISDIETALQSIKLASELQASAGELFAGLKKDLLSGMGDFAEVKAAIQEKATKQLTDLLRGGDIESLDRAQERLDELRRLSESGEVGIDLLGATNQEQFQADLDKAITDKASESVVESVMKMKLGNNNFDRLQAALKGFLSRRSIGSKEGTEARAFIRKTLAEVRDSQEMTPEGKAKKILLNHLLATVK